MPMERKILLGVLALVVIAAAVWFGKDLLPGDPPPPPPLPPPQIAAPATAPQASAPAVNREALIEEALEATGMNKAVDQIQEQMTAGMDAGGQGKLKPEVQALLRKTLLESFPPDSLRQRLRERFAADFNFNEPHLRALLADISGPVAQRMIALEARGGDDEAGLTQFLEKQRQTPLPEQRQALFRRLEAAVGASRQATEITLVTARAMMQGAGAAGGQSVADLEGELAKMRATLEPRMREGLLLSLAYTYRDASDEDLAAYAAIYESPHGKWFMDNIFQALREDFQANSERFGSRLTELIEAQRGPATAPGIASASGKAADGQDEAAPAAAQVRPHRRWHLDARACLKYEQNADVIRCAEKYY